MISNSLEEGAVQAEFFVIRNVALDGLAVTQGSLFVIEPLKACEIADRLTPSRAMR